MQISTSTYLKWIHSIVCGYKLRLFLHFILELFAIASSLLFIYYSKHTIDIALNVYRGDLDRSLIFVVLTAIFGVIFKSLSQWVNQQTQISMLLKLQYEVVEKQMLSSWSVIKKWNTGDILVRVNSDCNEIVQLLSTTCISFIITCIKVVAAFFFLYSLDHTLAWMILGITPLFLLTKFYFRKLRQLNINVKDAESNVGSKIQENLRHRVVLRSLGVLSGRLDILRQAQRKFEILRIKYVIFSLMSQTFMRSAMTVGYIIAFAWGIYKLRDMEITFGTMTAFLQLVAQIQSPILSFGAFFPAFVRFRVSLDRVQDVLNANKEPLLEDILPKNIEKIEFSNVSFKYEDEIIIDNMNAMFSKGTSTAILGASGKGKTTLIRLLLGLISPNDGNIKIHSDDSAEILNSAYINNISYVPQGNSLMTGTIRDNITLGQSDFNKGRLEDAIHLACAEFIYDLADGIDTKLGESGSGVSEGQAQRIAIARALYKNQQVLIFDESTSALDQNTTNLFLDRIKYLIKDKIVIFVTHDPAVAHQCDQQLLMD